MKKIPLGVRVELLKKLYDDLRSKFDVLKKEENRYSYFLFKKTPSRQQKISNEIEKLVSEFDNLKGDRAKNLSSIEMRINLISKKVALKEKYVAKMRGEIVLRYERVYKEKAENFLSSYNENPNREYSEEYNNISQLYNEIDREKLNNGLKISHLNIDKILINIDQINALEQKRFNPEYPDLSNPDPFTTLTLKRSPSTISSHFSPSYTSEPFVVTIGSSPNQSFAPVRSSSPIGNLGMAGATFVAIWLTRFLVRNFYIKEPEKKEEEMLGVSDIDGKLSKIFNENISFDKGESTIKFNNFSQNLCQKMANFFRSEGLVDNVSDDITKGLTLKKINELPAKKGKEVFDKFLKTFNDDLVKEMHEIAQKKLKQEELAKQQESIIELLELIESVNQKIQEIVEKEKQRLRKMNAPSNNKKGIKPNSRKEIDEKNRDLELLKKQLKAMNEFKKEKEKFGKISDDQESFFKKKFQKFDSLITNLQSKETITFQAVRVDVNKSSRSENKIIEDDQKDIDPQPFVKDDGEDSAPAPNPLQAKVANQDLTMADLIKLKAIFLEEGFTKIYYKKEKGAIQDIKIQNLRLGFLNQETLESESFEQEYQSGDNKKSLKRFGKDETDENLAKHYFHNLLEETVNDIYERKAQKTASEIDEKKSIKDNLYSFLNYAMGDMGAVLEDYKKREIEGEGRGGLTGLGHASRANLKDAEKLCLCLKMLKKGGELEHVESEQLKNFIGVELFTKKPLQESDSFTSLDVPIEKKPDDIFAQDLISKLVSEEKIKGHEEFKGKIVEFFKNNAEKFLENIAGKEVSDEYSQRISQVSLTTEFGGNTLKYLSENSDIVSDIIAFANKGEGDVVIESETKSSFKDELKSVYENMELRVREKEQIKAGAGLV